MLKGFRFNLSRRISKLPLAKVETLDFPELDKPQILNFKGGFLDEPEISNNLLFEIPSLDLLELFHPFDIPGTEDEISILESPTLVSDNLLQLLEAPATDGDKYYRKKDERIDQENLFGEKQTIPRSSAEIKAYSETKTSKNSFRTLQQSIWDLIYPILLPPLDFTFPEFIDLPSELYPFQQTGIEFLLDHNEALLGDEMGTGKTVMTAVALRILFQQGKIAKALIVFPLAALDVWVKHLDDWAPQLSKTVVRGTKESRMKDWEYPAHVYLATYDTIASDFLNVIKSKKAFDCPQCGTELHFSKKIHLSPSGELPDIKCPTCNASLENLPLKMSLLDQSRLDRFDIVIIDEAQYIKNRTSDRSRAVKILKPKWKWALTGTPLENRLDDLVSIFEFIKPNYLRLEGLTPRGAKELIQPHFIRRRKKDVWKELPEKVRQEIWLELDGDQQREYDNILSHGKDELSGLGEKVTRVHIFSLLSRLKQICNFPKGKTKSAKSEAIYDLVEEIVNNEAKVLVFSQYVEEGVSKLKETLDKFGIALHKGGMSDRERKEAIDRFRQDPQTNVFLATIKTGGVAITLTEANYVIHFDHWWNPAVMWQAEDRAHRKGQEKIVTVYSFWMKGTIEEKIYQKLNEKGLLFEEVIDGLSEGEIDNMISTEEWLDMLGIKTKMTEKPAEEMKYPELPLEEIFAKLEMIDAILFEEVVKRTFQKLGFVNARTTKRSHDEGVDIIASKHAIGGTEKVVIQCKRHISAVGVEHARALLGVVNDDPSISKGYLVVSGRLSNECRSFIERNGKLAYLEGPTLAKYIQQFGISLEPEPVIPKI